MTARDYYYPTPPGRDETNPRDAIAKSLGAEWPALIDTAEGWPAVQASRTENFDAFATDKVLKGLVNWLRAKAGQEETPSEVRSFLTAEADKLESDLRQRGLYS